MADIYDLFTGGDGTAQTQADALQAMLRGNQNAAGLAALSGAKSLQPFGAMTGGMAKQQENTLAEAGKARVEMAMKGQALRAAMAQHQATQSIALARLGEAMRHNGEIESINRSKMGGMDPKAWTVVKGPDGSQWNVNKLTHEAVPVTLSGAGGPGGGGEQFKTTPLPSDKQTGDIHTYDSALSRLDQLEGLYDQNPGTYRGANLLHNVANVFQVGDPKFAELRTLAQGHLFKGMKSEIGGRLTNFEIQYGHDLFPNENDPPPIAKAKISRLRQMLTLDRQNALDLISKGQHKDVTGLQNTHGTLQSPDTAPEPEPVKPPAAPDDTHAALRSKYGL